MRIEWGQIWSRMWLFLISAVEVFDGFIVMLSGKGSFDSGRLRLPTLQMTGLMRNDGWGVLNAAAVGVGVPLLVDGQVGLGSEPRGGVFLQLFPDLVDFRSEADEDVGHGVADFLGVRDYDSLAVTQDDVAGHSHDGGVVGNTAQNDRACADATVVAHGNVAENLGARANNDLVADGGMTLAFFLARAAQGDALIHRNVVAYDAGLADYNAHAMVDEEALTDL